MNLKPATINFTFQEGTAIYKGAPWEIEIGIANVDGGEETPIDVTDLEGICQIRANAQSAQAVAEPAVAIHDGPGGLVRISLTAEQTAAIPTAGKGFRDVTQYFIELKLGGGRVLHGIAEVSPTIIQEAGE